MSFVHLHVHTHYSILDGYATASELFERAKALNMPGLAITDHATLGGVPEFMREARKYPEVKPVIGCEFNIVRDGEHTDKDLEHRRYAHVVLLAKSLKGFENLVKLCSIANVEGFYYKPRISHSLLAQCHEGLICLSGCLAGEISQLILEGDRKAAAERALWYKHLFGEDYYFEVNRHATDNSFVASQFDNIIALKEIQSEVRTRQKSVNKVLLEFSENLGIKVVATNDVHFSRREDAIPHDILTSFQANWMIDDPKRLRYTHHEWLKSKQDMRALFSDCPAVIDNTMEVLTKIERFEISGPNMDYLMQEERIRNEGISGRNTYEEVLAYANREYGNGTLARIVTYRRLGEKEASNRVARVLSVSLYDLLSEKYPLDCDRLQEIRSIGRNLVGRVFNRTASEALAICPSGPIMERIPCISYSSHGGAGPALCTEYDIHSEELADMIIVK